MNPKSEKPAATKAIEHHSIWEKLSIPLLLLLVSVLAYGVLWRRIGFYLDDWYIILFQQKFGASGFWAYFSQDRPLESIPYVFLFSFMSDTPLFWAGFAIFSRWLLSLAFWISLNKLFPKHRKVWIWAVLIFTVFPGFKNHNFSIMFSIFYLFFTCHIFSFYGMARAIENRSKAWLYALWTSLSLFLLSIGIGPVEYYFGLELFRPILLWIMHHKENPQNRKKTFKLVLLDYLPYLLLLIAFLVYRISQRSTYQYEIKLLDQLKTTPWQTIQQLATQAFHSVIDGLYWAWSEAFKQLYTHWFELNHRKLILLCAVSLPVILGALAFIFHKKRQKPDFDAKAWVLMPIGLILCVLSLIPFYAGGFRVGLAFPWNRFYLAMLPGIALFSAGFIEFFIRNNTLRYITIALLCVIGIGSHFLVRLDFISQWDKQLELWQQLTWRVPGLERGTALITADSGTVSLFSGSTLTGPLNLIYAPEDKSSEYTYYLVFMDSNQKKYIPSLEANRDILAGLRSLKFNGNTNKLLSYLQPEHGCVQVLSDGIVPSVPNLNYGIQNWQEMSEVSNLNTIIPNLKTPAQLPERYFGKTDTNQWCYYYQKADLARQLEDWDEVIGLYQQAKDAGFEPLIGSEYRVLVEAWLKSDRAENFENIKSDLEDQFPTIKNHWCTVAHELISAKVLSGSQQEFIINLNEQKQCGK